MKIVQVNYTRQRPASDPEQAAAMTAAAERLAQLPGMIWKIWSYDDEAQTALSVYLFDTEANARAFGDGPLEASLGANPGIGNIVVTYFDVDEGLSAITRGPVGAAG